MRLFSKRAKQRRKNLKRLKGRPGFMSTQKLMEQIRKHRLEHCGRCGVRYDDKIEKINYIESTNHYCPKCALIIIDMKIHERQGIIDSERRTLHVFKRAKKMLLNKYGGELVAEEL